MLRIFSLTWYLAYLAQWFYTQRDTQLLFAITLQHKYVDSPQLSALYNPHKDLAHLLPLSGNYSSPMKRIYSYIAFNMISMQETRFLLQVHSLQDPCIIMHHLLLYKSNIEVQYVNHSYSDIHFDGKPSNLMTQIYLPASYMVASYN